MYYRLDTLAQNITSNGDYPNNPVLVQGDRSIALYGTFDGATVELVLHTEGPNGVVELPVSTDLTFTAAEAPSKYSFPEGMPVLVRVSNAGASTDISVNLHKFV